MLIGTTVIGTPRILGLALPSDFTYVFEFAVPEDAQHTSALAMYLDGNGPGAASGDATVTPVLYHSDSGSFDHYGERIDIGPPVDIPANMPAQWVTLRLDNPGRNVVDPLNKIFIGVATGGTRRTVRAYGVTAVDAGRVVTGPVDGIYPPEDVYSAYFDPGYRAAVVLSVFPPHPVPNVDDLALSRLPWDMTQRAFGKSGALPSTRRSAVAGWHGSTTDPEQGAVCVVRSDGPLAELVGERVQVTNRVGTHRRTIVVYCHDEEDFPDEVINEDLSLTRRGFMELAPWCSDSLAVEVTVMA